jgi:molecular chaperone GrpE
MLSRKKTARREGERRDAPPVPEETALESDSRDPAVAEAPPPASDVLAEPVEAPAEPQIEELKAQLAELEDRHLRLAAEFDNFRKRVNRERVLLSDRAQAEMAKQLLESLDDLARVSELGAAHHDATAILEGVQLVESKLRRALDSFGLRPIDAVGQPFNPELHEAILAVPTDRADEDEIVSQELAKGYWFKETVLRPARVGVKKYQAAVDEREAASE